MQSLYISICDDEAEQVSHLHRLTSAWAQERGHITKLRTFPSAEAFMFSGEDIAAPDILLLDIQMPGVDGMALAKSLRERGFLSQIIFVTGYADWIAEGYEVDAVHYLLKPVDTKKLCDALDKAVSRINKSVRTILFDTPDGKQRVIANDIVYAEAFSHYIELHTLSQTIRIKTTLTALEKTLGEGFLRCHRSYIAGLYHVSAISRGAVTLETGAQLPLSRKMYDAVNEAFIRYNWGVK